MDIKEICDRANRNEELPDCLQLHEELLFLSLRHVYNDFHGGKIDLEQARREKNRILYRHELWKKSQDSALSAARRYQQITIATEGARSELRCQIRDKAPADKIIGTAVKMAEIWDCLQMPSVKEE